MDEVIEALIVELRGLRQRYPGGMFVGIRSDPLRYMIQVVIRVWEQQLEVSISEMEASAGSARAIAHHTVDGLEAQLKEHLAKQYVREHR